MIKCIAIDMDGTLLNAEQQVSEENRLYIEKAVQKGIEVVIATGRSYKEARFVLDQANIDCPIICTNGAEVRNNDGDVVASHPLTKEQALNAVQILKENEIYFEVYTNKATYSDQYDKGISTIVDILSSANPEYPVDRIIEVAEERFELGLVEKIEDYEKVFEDPDQKILKLLAFSFDLERLAKVRDELHTINEIVISSSGEENLEISSTTAQKGVALDAFTKNRGINLQDTMAIGDNYNDISMFKRVGRAVAMGNASEIIKAQCHFVTETNIESGVAKAIKEALGV